MDQPENDYTSGCGWSKGVTWLSSRVNQIRLLLPGRVILDSKKSHLGLPDQCDTADNMDVPSREYRNSPMASSMEVSSTNRLTSDVPVINEYDKAYTPRMARQAVEPMAHSRQNNEVPELGGIWVSAQPQHQVSVSVPAMCNMALTTPKINMQVHYEERYVSMKSAFLQDPDLQLPSNASDSYVGALGHNNDTGSSMPSSAGSEPPEASPEQFRGRKAGNREAKELYERQMTPKITDAENSFTVLQFYSFPDPSSDVALKRATPLQLGCISNMNAEDKASGSSGIRIMGYQLLSRRLKTIPTPTAIRKRFLHRQPKN